MIKVAWHFDFHTPGYVTVGENPDFDGMTKALKSAGIEEIITFAKCHYGYAYYPTKVGSVHPGLKSDIFGGVLSACRKANIRVIAYLSFGIDGQAVVKHPDWQMNKDDEIFISDDPDVFLSVCPFSPYIHELILPMIEEIINLYHPDGFFFDTMGAFGICKCKWCQKSFRDETGNDIPEDENSSLQGLYGKWRHDRGVKLLKDISEFIQNRLPGALVGFNQIGSFPYPEPLPEGITVLTLDPPTGGPQSINLATNAAFSITVDRPADIMPTIFNQGWRDWSLAPLTRLHQSAATIWSHGARLYVGDRLRPEGRLDQQTLVALNFVKKLRNRLNKYFPENGSKPKPDILILHTPELVYGDDYRFFAKGYIKHWELVGCCHRLLLESGTNVAIIAQHNLSNWLGKAKLLVLPELTFLKPNIAGFIKNWVENGGCLLIVGCLPVVDGKQLDWAGITVEDEVLQDHIYLPSWSQKDSLPTLVIGNFHHIKLNGAEKIMPAILPYQSKPGKKYGWGIGPASQDFSDYPVVCSYKLGKGEVWYFGACIFSDYFHTGKWQQVMWIKGLLEKIPVKFSLSLNSISGNVEGILWEKEKIWWVLLVNHGGEEIVGRDLPGWARTVGPVPPRKIVVNLRNNGLEPVSIISEKQKIDFSFDGTIVSFPFVLKDVWKIIKVDWQ